MLKRLSLLLLFTPSLAYAVIEDCSHGVRFDHGGTMEGVTAQVECHVRGKPQIKTRSVAFKNGKRHGKTTRYDGFYSGTRNPKNRVSVIEHYKDGKEHGKFMRYDDKTGRVEKEETYKDGIKTREVFHFAPPDGGKRITFSRKHEMGNFAQDIGSVSYNRANQLTAKKCPKKASGIPELDNVCGFGSGAAKTTNLHNNDGKVVGTTTQKNGRVNESKSFYPSGKLKALRTRNSQKFYYENGNLQEEVVDSANRTQMVTEYYENGKKKKYIHTVQRRLQNTRAWYINGKTKYLVARQGNSERVVVKAYYGNGRLYQDYIYVPKSRYSMFMSSFYKTRQLVGTSRVFHENGKLWEVVSRDKNHKLKTAKIHYESGKLGKTIVANADGTQTITVYNKDGSLKESGTYYSDGSKKE